jgi:hypothetical protein
MDVNMDRILSVVNTAPVREAMPKSETEAQPTKDGYFAQQGEIDPNKPMSLKDKAILTLFKGVKKEIQALNNEMVAKDNKQCDKDPAVGEVDSLEQLGKASKSMKGSFDPETKEVNYNMVNAKLEPVFEANFLFGHVEEGIIAYGAEAKVPNTPAQTQLAFVEAPDGRIAYKMMEGTPPAK